VALTFFSRVSARRSFQAPNLQRIRKVVGEAVLPVPTPNNRRMECNKNVEIK
jgi:hypothetical protein